MGVVVLNPRIFVKVLDRLRMRGVEIIVPVNGIDLNEISNKVKTIIVDREVYDRIAGKQNIGVNILVIEDEIKVDNIVEKALCMLYGKKEYNEVIIGVDAGPGYVAYAVVADGEVAELGKISEAKIPELIRRVVETYPHRNMIIRIGASHKGPEIAFTILNLVEKYNIGVELVEEENTTKPTILDINRKLRDKDINAAINISFKPGNKVTLS